MSAEGVQAAIDEVSAEFSVLSDWEERYAHVIDLGRALAPLSEAEHNEATRVRGCASQVWLVCETRPEAPGRLFFRGDSDAHLVRGLIALLLRVFSGRTAQEILTVDTRAIFSGWGLGEALTPQRSNGFFAMAERIRRFAEERAAPVS